MKPTDLKAENSDETIGRSLRRRPLARKNCLIWWKKSWSR
jgi:hypothetical protein